MSPAAWSSPDRKNPEEGHKYAVLRASIMTHTLARTEYGVAVVILLLSDKTRNAFSDR